MRKIYLYVLALAFVFVACDKGGGGDTPQPEPDPGTGYNVGDVLHSWEKGCLDFHGISTGRGECWLMILPDGTSVLIDAGEVPGGTGSVPQRPNSSIQPHSTIVRYLKQFLPATGGNELDYMFLTHFHTDHMGSTSITSSSANGYKHIGMSSVFDEVRCKKLIDRGWPTYDSNPEKGYYKLSKDGGSTSNDTPEWIKFTKYINTTLKIPVEFFKVGSSTQFAMTKGGGYDCVVKNIVGNGYYLTTSGSVLSESLDAENPCSSGIHVRYGKFDLITCGDCVSWPQNRVASYAIAVTPGKKLEVFKGHHHLHLNSWGSGMDNADFSPQVVIAESFYKTDSEHLTTTVLNKATSKANSVFLTNVHPESVKQYPDVFAKVKGYDGHFVIRVKSDGQYNIYQLDDTNFEYKIKAKFGPYTSR